MSEHLQQFEKIIKSFSNEYTHLYAACGDIRGTSPEFFYENYADDKRLFDLSSLTKALVTVPLVFSKINEIQETVSPVIPKSISLLKKNDLTWIDLLSHESGISFWNNLWVKQFDDQGNCLLKSSEQVKTHLDKVLSRQDFPTKKHFVYSDLGYLFLQRLLEEKLQSDYKSIVTNFLKEAQLDKQFVFLPEAADSISTGYCQLRKRNLFGEVHDENAAALGGVCTHAGAFASGEGLRSGLQKIIDSSYGKKLVLAQQSRLTASKKHPGLAGWWQGNGESAKVFAQGQSIGHLGFTGTAFWYDPQSHYYGILLTNRVIKGRVSHKITQLRTAVFKFYEQLRST